MLGGSAFGASASTVDEGEVVGAAVGTADGEPGSSGRLVGSTIVDGVGDDDGIGGGAGGGSGTDSVGVGVAVGVGLGVWGGGLRGRRGEVLDPVGDREAEVLTLRHDDHVGLDLGLGPRPERRGRRVEPLR